MKRSEILEAARCCVCGEREQDYGTPEDSFGLIGQLWTAYMGTLFTSKDVAMMMALLKVARIKAGDKADSFIDLAGYAACAGEIVTESGNPDPEVKSPGCVTPACATAASTLVRVTSSVTKAPASRSLWLRTGSPMRTPDA